MEDTVLRLGNLIVTPCLTDVLLAKAYFRMLEDGTLDIVFHQSRPSLQDFLQEYMTHGLRVTLGCFRENNPDEEPEFCGLGWAYGAVKMDGFTKAECGCVFFKKQVRKTDNVAFGRMIFEAFFTNHDVDVLFGTIPENNKLSLRYAQKIGMSLHGPIPDLCTWKGELVDGWLSHISKAQWKERGN